METTVNTIHATLCDKMRAELNEYVASLLEEPPMVILSHSWEYSTLADILHKVEDTEFTDLQMMALLESDHPLQDIFNAWSALETDIMEQLEKCISNTAEEAWRESFKKCVACKEAIEDTIRANYKGWTLDTKACVQEVVSRFGYDRVFLVLATTVRKKDWDARISDKNKAWAQTIPVYDAKCIDGSDRANRFVVDKVNPGLTDLFLDAVRKSYSEKQERT